MNSFGNIIAEIGAVNKNKPGNYLIRRADDVVGPSGLQNASDLSTATNAQNRPHNASAYAGIVNLPTTHGTMLIRLVSSNLLSLLFHVKSYVSNIPFSWSCRTLHPTWT